MRKEVQIYDDSEEEPLDNIVEQRTQNEFYLPKPKEHVAQKVKKLG